MLACTSSPGTVRKQLAGWRLMLRCLLALLFATSAAGCAALPSNEGRTPSHALAAPEQTELGRMVQARRALDHARSDSGFLLLDSVDGAFSSRLALIESAQRS